jgi:hypothetical protein
VNRTFVRHFLAGNPLGVRFRYVAPYERRGTRPETPMKSSEHPRLPEISASTGLDGNPTVYHPAAPGDVHPFVRSGMIQRQHSCASSIDFERSALRSIRHFSCAVSCRCPPSTTTSDRSGVTWPGASGS